MMRSKTVAVAAVALLAAGGVGSALAASSNNPKSNIESGNFFCGFDVPSLQVIGFTNYHRTGDVVSVEYHLKNGIPNSTYSVSLWGDLCSFFGNVVTVTTNANGVANGNGDVTVPAGSTRFFATSFGPNGFNDTPAVTLTP